MNEQSAPPVVADLRQHRPAAPPSVSDMARAYLDQPDAFKSPVPAPALDDIEGWERFIHDQDLPVLQMLASLMPSTDQVKRRTADIDGVATYELQVASAPEDARALFIDIHGGGLVQCGGDLAWMMSMGAVVGREGLTWAPDYRMPPRHPYPAALEDCLAVYRKALEIREPNEIVVSGASAGGNLAAALMLRAKDEGLPLPAALVLATPEVDLTESGDTFRTNLGIDIIGSLMTQNLLYAAGADLSDPYLSPLFGDVAGFPPTFLVSGTRDLYLSNTVRFHRKLLAAAVPTELHILEAMPHGGFGGASPEDQELSSDIRRFERAHLGATATSGSRDR